MKILFLSLILSIFLFTSLVKGQTPTLKPSISVILAIKKQTDSIANYIVKHKDQVIVFAKVPGKKIPVRVKNDKWPEDVDYSYNILKDSAGKVIFAAEIPYSESGDWNIEYRHYFDSDGNTIAFERITNVFDSDVKGGVIYETLINYYSTTFKLVDKVYALTQKNGKNIKNNGHVNMYRYPYSIYKNSNDCLKAYNIYIGK